MNKYLYILYIYINLLKENLKKRHYGLKLLLVRGTHHGWRKCFLDAETCSPNKLGSGISIENDNSATRCEFLELMVSLDRSATVCKCFCLNINMHISFVRKYLPYFWLIEFIYNLCMYIDLYKKKCITV